MEELGEGLLKKSSPCNFSRWSLGRGFFLEAGLTPRKLGGGLGREL